MSAVSLNQELTKLQQELENPNLNDKQRLALSEKLRLEALDMYEKVSLENMKLKSKMAFK